MKTLGLILLAAVVVLVVAFILFLCGFLWMAYTEIKAANIEAKQLNCKHSDYRAKYIDNRPGMPYRSQWLCSNCGFEYKDI